MPQTSVANSVALAPAVALAAEQEGMISRPQLYGLGVTRWQVRANLRAARWQRIGDQSVCVHTGPLSQRARHWAAVFQGGPRAQLDGASALIESGLTRFEVDRVRVSVPRGAKVRRNAAFDIRQTRRWAAADLMPSGIPRTRPEVATVRAGLWAWTDRQAALVVTMAVQQGITTAEAVGHQLIRIRRDRRRLLLHALVNDLLDGARSLGELEIGDQLARRRLPRPDRQVLRKDHRGRYFLDLYWPRWQLVVEIDGIHHTWAENVVGDALRQNSLVLDGDTVLRLPLLGLRLEPDEFLDQIEQALRAAGWSPDVIRVVA
jgi:very-short-patch-repair endonuclease